MAKIIIGHITEMDKDHLIETGKTTDHLIGTDKDHLTTEIKETLVAEDL